EPDRLLLLTFPNVLDKSLECCALVFEHREEISERMEVVFLRCLSLKAGRNASVSGSGGCSDGGSDADFHWFGITTVTDATIERRCIDWAIAAEIAADFASIQQMIFHFRSPCVCALDCATETLSAPGPKDPAQKWCYLGRLLYCHQKIFDPRLPRHPSPPVGPPPSPRQAPFANLLAATVPPIFAAGFLKAKALWFDLAVQKLPGQSDHSSTHVTLGVGWAAHALYGKTI